MGNQITEHQLGATLSLSSVNNTVSMHTHTDKHAYIHIYYMHTQDTHTHTYYTHILDTLTNKGRSRTLFLSKQLTIRVAMKKQ